MHELWEWVFESYRCRERYCIGSAFGGFLLSSWSLGLVFYYTKKADGICWLRWGCWRKLQIVILGGNGFVGSAIAKEAVKQDIDVVSFSRWVFLSTILSAAFWILG